MKLRIIHIVYLLPVILTAYLFWQNTKPELRIAYDLKGKSAMVSALVPLSRVSDLLKDELGSYRTVNSEPVYLDVRLPRKYDQAEIAVEYSDLQNNIFEIGVSRDSAKKSFDFLPLENKILDGLNWLRPKEDGLTLYQRKAAYDSVSEFFKNPAGYGKTLVYRTDAEPSTGGLKRSGKTVIDFPIKKSAKMMVYHDGGKLEISVQASGDYKTNVYQNNATISYPTSDSLKAGFYKVEIIGDEEALYSQISVNSPYVAILDSLNLGELVRPLKIYFAGSRFLARAETADGLQKITTGKDGLEISEALTQYKKIFADRSLKSITVPSGNIELGGTLFFIDNKNIFYPRYENLYSGADLKNIDFILAKYAPPTESGGIKTAKAVFDLQNTDFSNEKIRFLLSLPNGSSDGNLVKIRGIKIKFTGEKYGLRKIYFKLVSYLAN